MLTLQNNSFKIFTNLPPHWSVSARYDVIMVNAMNWNLDNLNS